MLFVLKVLSEKAFAEATHSFHSHAIETVPMQNMPEIVYGKKCLNSTRSHTFGRTAVRVLNMLENICSALGVEQT